MKAPWLSLATNPNQIVGAIRFVHDTASESTRGAIRLPQRIPEQERRHTFRCRTFFSDDGAVMNDSHDILPIVDEMKLSPFHISSSAQSLNHA